MQEKIENCLVQRRKVGAEINTVYYLTKDV